MDLFLIDAIAPFFLGHQGRKINWSKAPFEHMRPDLDLDGSCWRGFEAGMERYCAAVAQLGYNAVTLDDVAHLARSPLYEPEFAAQIDAFREKFARIFEIVEQHGLSIYVTMDVMSYTPALDSKVGTQIGKVAGFMVELLDRFLLDFTQVRGVVMRVGECDGLDVKSGFRSRLVLKQPRDVKQLLRAVLPVFERSQRELICRTWTVGSYRLGDLIWHRKRLAEVFSEIDSPALTISMKYGESDFYRFLGVNSHFFRLKQKSLVELQARREYEGCGEFPSFIGSDYAEYARTLRTSPNLRGISVWVQTGGWTSFKRLAFLDKKAVWNEINAAVTVAIFKEGKTPEDAVRVWAAKNRILDADALIRLLNTSEQLVKRLLYIPDIASQKLFFRRVRVPPLLHVYWNNIFINHSAKRILNAFAHDRAAIIRDGWEAMSAFPAMEQDAASCGLAVEDIHFMRDTFRLLALSREYYFGAFSDELAQQLRAAKREYKRSYPKSLRPRYRVRLNFQPFPVGPRTIRFLGTLFLRRQRGYRLVDQVVVLRFLSLVYWVVRNRRPELLPKFARKSAMGVDTIFR